MSDMQHEEGNDGSAEHPFLPNEFAEAAAPLGSFSVQLSQHRIDELAARNAKRRRRIHVPKAVRRSGRIAREIGDFNVV